MDSSIIREEFSVLRHSLHADEHLATGGVVVELYLRLALAVGLHVGLPVDGAAEVLHGWDDGVILHLEGLALAVALEMRAA